MTTRQMLEDLGMRPEDAGPALAAAQAQAEQEDGTWIWWAITTGTSQDWLDNVSAEHAAEDVQSWQLRDDVHPHDTLRELRET